jgi:predicted nucleic acid-binding Zn ribbon protein
VPRTFQSPDTCPVCGATVPAGAKACPGCGADERSGWDDELTRYDGLDLPDDSFDYDETLRDEGLKSRRTPQGVRVFWWLIGLVVLGVFIALALNHRLFLS